MAVADGGPTEAQKNIVDYLKKHSIEPNLNDVVSKCAKVRKDDPWGFMIEEFRKLQTICVTDVTARQIFDGSGNPTIEAEIVTTRGTYRATVPCGDTTRGKYEASYLRDGGNDYQGLGVSQAISNIIDAIKPELVDMELKGYDDQKKVDKILIEQLAGEKGEDKTELGWKKTKLGANAVLAVSMAFCRASAANQNMSLFRYIAQIAGNAELMMPVPCFTVLAGGNSAGNKLPSQEIMILPTGAKTFREAMKMGTEVYHQLKLEIKKKYRRNTVSVGPAGGLVANIPTIQVAVELIQTTLVEIHKIHPEYEDKIKIAIDADASAFYNSESKDDQYDLNFKDRSNSKNKKSAKLLEMYVSLANDSGVVSIEDPFDQDHWDAWTQITETLGTKVQITGDNLLVTNPIRIQRAIEEKACNALSLKMSQIGTLTETIEAVKLAKNAGWGVTCSHTSGDTDDNFISHLAVGLCTGQISAGAPCRFERISKYNELLRIEDELDIGYAGDKFRCPGHPY